MHQDRQWRDEVHTHKPVKISTRYSIRGFLLLLLAGGIALVATRQNAIARLHTENQTLLASNNEVRQLKKENADIPRLHNEVSQAEQLREENRELLRLRSEVGQLRSQLMDLAMLRAENQRLQAQAAAVAGPSPSSAAPATPPGFVTRAMLCNAGQDTPENTIQTAFWAMTQGRPDLMVQCRMTDEAARKQIINALDFQAQSEEMSREFATFPGYSIVGKTNLAPDEVSLGLQTSANGAVLPMKLKYDGSQWKLEQ